MKCPHCPHDVAEHEPDDDQPDTLNCLLCDCRLEETTDTGDDDDEREVPA